MMSIYKFPYIHFFTSTYSDAIDNNISFEYSKCIILDPKFTEIEFQVVNSSSMKQLQCISIQNIFNMCITYK